MFEQKARDNWNAVSAMYVRKALLDGLQGALWLYYANILKSGGWWPVWIMAIVFCFGMYLTFRKGRQEDGWPILEIAETLASVVAGVAASFVAVGAIQMTQIGFVAVICFFWAALDLYHPLSWVMDLFGGGNLACELRFHASLKELDEVQFDGYMNAAIQSDVKRQQAKAAAQQQQKQ